MRPNPLPFDKMLDALFSGSSPPSREALEIALRTCANCGYYAGAHDLLTHRFSDDPFGAPQQSFSDMATDIRSVFQLACRPNYKPQ